MSEKKFFPVWLRVLVLAGGAGIVLSACCLAAMAALMAERGYSGSVAVPMATAAVGFGSLCGGWLAAFLKKERGLLCGLAQGLFYAVILALLRLPSGTLAEPASLARLAIVALCGSAGGVLGMISRERRHHR